MVRRKVPHHAPRAASTTSHSPTAKDHVSARDYYKRRYEEMDKKRRSTGLYEDSTKSHMNRMEGLWKEYCKVVNVDPYHTLKKSPAGRINNFFHWMCNEYTVRKVSSVTTYWHQLSQVYIKYKGRRISPLVLKKVYEFIVGPLAQEHGLDDSETDKPLLDVEDFLEVLRCHWVTDTNSFPHERQRVQVATLLLLAAVTGSRPGALLGITYRDIDLFVLRDPKTGEVALTLQLRLKKTKSRQKRKRPKTYTFFVDNNPMFCVISHIVALACDDEAFRFPKTTPRVVFTLGVRPGLNCQPIQWHDDMKDQPVFCASSCPGRGKGKELHESLPYSRYQEWVKRLGEETGFVQVLTTYCLRRASGNAINDDPNSNEAVRNLVLDHASSMIFQRNYLSRMIRYDTQAAYRGTVSRGDLIVASHRMSRTIDPRRPRGPSLQQLQHLRQDAGIQELREHQHNLYIQIREKFNFIYRAEGQPIYDEYQQVKRDIDRLLKEKGRALKAQLQADYDAAAPMQDMLAQLAVHGPILSPVQPRPAPVEYPFEERARIAQAFFDPPSSAECDGNPDRQISIVDDLVTLCTRQERRLRKPRRSWEDDTANSSSDDNTDMEIKSEYSGSDVPAGHHFPLQCRPFQCLHCIGNATLPLLERQHVFGSKHSLQRHHDRHHGFQPGQNCPFPNDECAQLALASLMHFKNHAAGVHGIYMSDKQSHQMQEPGDGGIHRDQKPNSRKLPALLLHRRANSPLGFVPTSVLRHVSVKVVICEEAGEVLEAHMLSALIPSAHHLIQIGDQQQLRPQINNHNLSLENPLGRLHQLDRSQFERLSVGERGRPPFSVSQLSVQRRMRPDISALIRNAQYPRLEDHASVRDLPNVIGMRNNIFWLDHKRI
ncbi:uncharacterized protein KY384_003272 [Bacidia gigantensis]|uniref:uncharacterized protein n=1 Tax=Bacidia gigantensis TaxID=2732470 RepID=UPI001D0582DD|nr:uncharacterized protein KY384_003272 [Bacidia gigantensis]KAG8531641.1 hypothetical protein KY384_003272 [Bacidia gigantensis]